MKTKEIRNLKEQDFEKKAFELKTELSKLQGQAATSTPPKNPGQIKQIKRTLARMLTIKKEKELGLNQKKTKEEKK